VQRRHILPVSEFRPRAAGRPALAPALLRSARMPLVSLILVVKNGMPFVEEALASVAAQTHRDLELVVQDGGSTDGTLEAIARRRDLPAVAVESGPDTVATAWARAFARCRGEIVGSVLADDRLEPDAVAHAVRAFAARPELAAVYGANRIVDAAGRELQVFEPADFDLLRVLECDLVPPFASAFFARRVCGDALRFDPAFTTCAEFDLWLRLGHLPIARLAPVLGVTRFHPKSMSRRPESYPQFCRDKIAAIERWLARLALGPLAAPLRARAVGGVYTWAADAVYELEGASPRFHALAAAARAADPGSRRYAALAARVDAAARARAEEAALAARLARMTGRREPLDRAELEATANALARVLGAPDVVAHVLAEAGRLPPATLPLLVVHLARCWASADAAPAAPLEALYGLLAAVGRASGAPAVASNA